MLSAEDGLFIQVLREGLIQIGDNESDIHQFNVIIHLKYAENLQNVSNYRCLTISFFDKLCALFSVAPITNASHTTI